MNERARAVIAVVVQTAIVIGGFFVGKEALHAIPAGPLVLMRSAGAALVLAMLAPVLARGEAPVRKPGDRSRLMWLGVAGVPVNQGLFLYGLTWTTAAHAALLYSLTPAIVFLMGVQRGVEKLTRARVLGILLALAGVVLVLLDAAFHAPAPVAAGAASAASHQAAGKSPIVGDLMILVAVFAWAGYTAYSRELVGRIGAVRATAGALGYGALLYAPIGIVAWWHLGWNPSTAPAAAWGSLAWLILLSSVVAYLLWYYAIKRLDPSRVAIFNNLQPIGVALGQWLVFGIPLGAAFMIGGSLAVAGVVTAQRDRLRPTA